MYYDNCTRKNHDGTDGYTNYFWCPNPNDVDDQNTFSMDEGDTIGECTEFLYPPGNFYYYLKKENTSIIKVIKTEVVTIFCEKQFPHTSKVCKIGI